MPTSVARHRTPNRDEPTSPAGIPGITSGPGTGLPGGPGFGSGSGGQSMAGGVPGAQRKLEYKQPLPGPGIVLGLPDANAASGYPGQAGLQRPQPRRKPSIRNPDFQSPSFNPGLLGQAEVQPTAQQQAAQLQSAAPASDSYLSQDLDESLGSP